MQWTKEDRVSQRSQYQIIKAIKLILNRYRWINSLKQFSIGCCCFYTQPHWLNMLHMKLEIRSPKGKSSLYHWNNAVTTCKKLWLAFRNVILWNRYSIRDTRTIACIERFRNTIRCVKTLYGAHVHCFSYFRIDT